MLAEKVVNRSDSKLIVRDCIVPFSKHRAGYRVSVLRDFSVNPSVGGVKPEPELLAIPNGYGYIDEGAYIFRRVDGIWVFVHDEALSEVLLMAVDCWSEGMLLTFEDLQSLTGVDTEVLSVAYSTGLLGPCEFKKKNEPATEPMVLYEGWLEENIYRLMAYRDGLALYEFWYTPIPHISTAHSLCKPVLVGRFESGRLVAGNVTVEDTILLEIAKMCEDAENVLELIQSSDDNWEEVEWGLAVLVAVGCVKLLSQRFLKAKER